MVARRARGPRIGVALSSDGVCAAIRRPGQARTETWRMPLSPLNGDGTAWPGLADALRALARDSGITDGRLTVALMPPLAEARGVELPPVSEAELQQLLTRGASKYFVAARGPQVVGAVRGARRSGREPVPTVAAAAGSRLVHAINEAAASAGWSVEAIIPAEAAWGAAAARWTGAKGGAAQLLVVHPDRTDLLRVDRGRLVGVRRFRSDGADAGLIADAFAGAAGRLAIVGNPDIRRELTRQLSARGVAIESPPGASTEVAEHPDLLAATFASPDAGPALVTESVRAARAASTRTFAVRLAMVAGALLVVSGILEWWGLRREFDAVRAQRAALSPLISSTLVGKQTVENAFRQLEVLASEQRVAPRWSSAIAAISERLPTDAFLTGFRGRGDSVSIDGLAEHAARVFDALDKVPSLTRVRAAGPVRIETPEDGPPLERFAIAAQLVRPGAPKTPVRPPASPPAAAPARGGSK